MTLDDAIAYYGSSYAMAKSLTMTPQSIYYWKKQDGRIPKKHQYRLEKLTQGQLKADETFPEDNNKDKRYSRYVIACPHCNEPIDLDDRHRRLTKKELKQRGHDHGD